MHYKSSYDALIMPHNAHYNVLYDYNNCNHCMSTKNKPLNIIMHTIIYQKIMHYDVYYE